MSKRKIHQDELGIFVKTNGTIYRPGAVAGYAHNPHNNMTDGGLQAGDTVDAKVVSGSPLCRVDGRLVWHVRK